MLKNISPIQPIKFIVIGDIHGQKSKLKKIFIQNGIIKKDSGAIWEVTEDFKQGRKHVVILGDLIHGEKEYIEENQQLSLLSNIIEMQKIVNGVLPDGSINILGPLVVTLGNHEEAEILRVDLNKTLICKKNIHQGIAPKGIYLLAEPFNSWFRTLPLSYQFCGFDFAHAGPFNGTDQRGLNKRLWDRDWYGDAEAVKREYEKKNILFGFYGHTVYGEDDDSNLKGKAGDVRFAANKQAAIIDVNRYTIGFIEIVKENEKWVIYKNINNSRQKIKTI